MATIIEMPKLSDTMTVGTVVKWHKQEGDIASNGDILAEIETDKATMELENFDDGNLLKILVAEGEEAVIGAPLAVIGELDEELPEIKVPKEPKADSPLTAADTPTMPQVESSEAPTPIKTAESSGRVRISPLAKKMAAEQNLDIHLIPGSGPLGRITKEDVESFSNSSTATPSVAPVVHAVSSSVDLIGRKLEAKRIPVSNIRSIIARRLLESKTTIPHFYLQREVNAQPLRLAREAINQKLASRSASPDPAVRVSLNDLILKACSEAILDVPEINSSWTESEIVFHENVDLAFGVAVPDGLVTPVIRCSQKLNLLEISQAAKTLITKARNKKLSPDEMSGSTFTVTNLGMFGVDFFSGIINPPNAAILSVGASVKKPVVAPNGAIQSGETMVLGLSCDHRLIDGALGAQFLDALSKNLENPSLMLV
jgi:pyruvate dehydrogenase E2 component (dihydrolipoamide acetyltransferase)